jgi:hypothetical protein
MPFNARSSGNSCHNPHGLGNSHRDRLSRFSQQPQQPNGIVLLFICVCRSDDVIKLRDLLLDHSQYHYTLVGWSCHVSTIRSGHVMPSRNMVHACGHCKNDLKFVSIMQWLARTCTVNGTGRCKRKANITRMMTVLERASTNLLVWTETSSGKS